jgi:phosphohistidine swiveling domain-containing protein
MKKFYLLEKLPVYNPMILESVSRAVSILKVARKFGIFPSNDLFIFKNGSMEIYATNQREKAAEKTFENLLKKPTIAHKLHRRLIENSLKMKVVSDRIYKLNLSKLTNRQILKEYKALKKYMTLVHSARCLGWLLETKFEILSKYLIDEIGKIIKKGGLNLDPTVIFSKLVLPTKETPAFEEKVELLKIADKIKNLENLKKLSKSDEIYKQIKSHFKNYFFIPYGQEWPGWSEEDILNNLKEILKAEKTPKKQLFYLQKEIVTAKKDKKEIIKKLKLKIHLREMIKIADDISYTKLFTKYYQFYCHACLDKILKEVGKRFIFSLRQMRYLVPSEFEALLSGKKINREELSERFIFSIFYWKDDKLNFLSRRKAEKFLKRIRIERKEDKISAAKEFFGQIAFAGFARGKVKIINESKDMKKMETGDILASEMTNPEIITAMRKAAAIITDEGGITCHAAIVSRELKITCVIGTKIATRVLKDEDLVEVDATKGIVKIIK